MVFILWFFTSCEWGYGQSSCVRFTLLLVKCFSFSNSTWCPLFLPPSSHGHLCNTLERSSFKCFECSKLNNITLHAQTLWHCHFLSWSSQLRIDTLKTTLKPSSNWIITLLLFDALWHFKCTTDSKDRKRKKWTEEVKNGRTNDQ